MRPQGGIGVAVAPLAGVGVRIGGAVVDGEQKQLAPVLLNQPLGLRQQACAIEAALHHIRQFQMLAHIARQVNGHGGQQHGQAQD